MVSLDILAKIIMSACMYTSPTVPAYDKLNCGEYVTNCTIGAGYDKLNEEQVKEKVNKCADKYLNKNSNN